jgi:hypothetical protein
MPSWKVFFILLGGFKSMNFDEKDQSAINNLFEEWSCLVLKTLPSTMLSKALPSGFVICESDIHLTGLLPFNKGITAKRWQRGNFETAIELPLGVKVLLVSHDPEIRAYFERWGNYYDLPLWGKLEGLRLGRAIREQTHFRDLTIMQRKRRSFDSSHSMRDADLERGT